MATSNIRNTMFHVLSNNANTREKWRVYPSVGHHVLELEEIMLSEDFSNGKHQQLNMKYNIHYLILYLNTYVKKKIF